MPRFALRYPLFIIMLCLMAGLVGVVNVAQMPVDLFPDIDMPAVVATTSTTSIVFFPVTFLSGISKYIFTPLGLGVVFSIFASYFFAMTVVPLFWAAFIRIDPRGCEKEGHTDTVEGRKPSFFKRLLIVFDARFRRFLDGYGRLAYRVLQRPAWAAAAFLGGLAIILLGLFPFLGRAYFPRTDPGQFVINVRMPSGTRLEVSDQYVARVENVIRSVVKPRDLGMIVSNIGVYPGLSAIFTNNASIHAAFVQTGLNDDHRIGSYEYMRRVQQKLSQEMPELSTYFQAGGLVDGAINQGLPALIGIRIGSNDMEGAFALARNPAAEIRTMLNVSSVYIPQDLDYPGIALNIDRERASLIGLSVIVTVFLVPAVYLVIHGRRERKLASAEE